MRRSAANDSLKCIHTNPLMFGVKNVEDDARKMMDSHATPT
jgi:hypothetical protein